MSSNGIGLQTARGSGTTGHIQKNIASANDHNNDKNDSGYFKKRQILKQRKVKNDKRSKRSSNEKVAAEEIKIHYLKRDIEVKCMELRDSLEDESEDEQIILTKVNNLRTKLQKDFELLEDRAGTRCLDSSRGENDKNVQNENKGDAYMYKRRYTDSKELDRNIRARIRK